MNYSDNDKILRQLKGMPDMPMGVKEKKEVLHHLLQFEETVRKKERRAKRITRSVKGITLSVAAILLLFTIFTMEGNQLAAKLWSTITAPFQEKELVPLPVDEEMEQEEENVISHDQVYEDAIYFLTLIKDKDVETLKDELKKVVLLNPNVNENSPEIIQIFDIIDEKMEDMIDLYHQIIDFDLPMDVSFGGGYVYERDANEFHLQINNLQEREDFGYSEIVESDYFLGEPMVIYYWEDQPLFSSRIFEHYPTLYILMNKYIQAIKEDDIKGISYLLEPWRKYSLEEDAAYPDELAQRVIDNYKETMDRDSLETTLELDAAKRIIAKVKDEMGNIHSFILLFDGHTEVIMDEKIPFDITIFYPTDVALVELQTTVNEILHENELGDYVVKWMKDPLRNTTFVINSHRKGTQDTTSLEQFEDIVKDLAK